MSSQVDNDGGMFHREPASLKLSRQMYGESAETVEKNPAPPPQQPQKNRKNSASSKTGRQVSIDDEAEQESNLGAFGFKKGSSLYLSQVSMESAEHFATDDVVEDYDKRKPTYKNQSAQTDLSCSHDEILRKLQKLESDTNAKGAIKHDHNSSNQMPSGGKQYAGTSTKNENPDIHDENDDKQEEADHSIKNSSETKPKIKHSDDLRTRTIKKSVLPKKNEPEDSDDLQHDKSSTTTTAPNNLKSHKSVGSGGEGETTRSGDISLEEKIATYVTSGKILTQKPSQDMQDDDEDEAEEKLSRFGSMRFSEKFS
ncbi:hypothetical protein HK098_002873 [Nowakowskiella sp. JEL0407]|nr:hypothetical protein HK098_002873 [Nowakowskiella sp. JEL0407]